MHKENYNTFVAPAAAVPCLMLLTRSVKISGISFYMYQEEASLHRVQEACLI